MLCENLSVHSGEKERWGFYHKANEEVTKPTKINRKGKRMHENELAKLVYECGLQIHKTLGPGLLESAYEECMFYELSKYNVRVEKQKPLPLVYEEVKLEIGYRVDLMLENKLIVEIKSVKALEDVHLAQVLTYLKLSGCKLGLLINFNTALFKNGVRRIISGYL